VPNPPHLPTAAVADAAVRLRIPVRMAPSGMSPLQPDTPFSGIARPVTHFGSVDVFLDAIDDAPAGSVLVIDNGGRDDEACVGDLVVLEAKLAGLAGVVVWGRHRDTAQLRQIGLPVVSRGACPLGPLRVPPAGRTMRSAVLGGVPVTDEDLVVSDDDGVMLVGPERREELLDVAAQIVATETRQAERMAAGTSLRRQLDFAGYRRRQAADPQLTLRQHLIELGSAIEV
jgi:4-hydroxy-4-methyl-2-oxoglutarate aldolase